MKCTDLELCAIEYMEGKLPSRQREMVQLHLAACRACAGRLRGFADVSRLLGAWEGIQPSASFDARLEQQIAAGAASTRWWERLLPWAPPPGRRYGIFSFERTALVGAMAAVLLVALALVSYHPSATPQAATQMSAAPVAMAAPGAGDELALYQDLPVLENWDMLSNFEVLQDLKGTAP